MSIGGRISKAEAGLGDALLWTGVKKLASTTGESPEELFHEATAVIDRYWHLATRRPGGKLDIEPVLRAMAAGEGLDYGELAEDVKHTLRLQRRRERGRRS